MIASLPSHPSLLESLQFQGVGLAVVIVALIGLRGLIWLTGICFKTAVNSSPKKIATSTGPLSPMPTGMDTELVAVIAAAVNAAVGTPHKILSIKPVSEAERLIWSTEGRRDIFSSHRIR